MLLAQPDLAALAPRELGAAVTGLGTACARAGAGWGLAVRQGLDWGLGGAGGAGGAEGKACRRRYEPVHVF